MPVRQTITTGAVPVKIFTDEVEASALEQLENVSQLPIVHHHVAAMPDVHAGIGATVGTVIATDRAIIPAAVGVDIGCGMIAARTSLSANALDEAALRRVYEQISRDVPVGREQHRGESTRPATAALRPGLQRLLERHPHLARSFPRTQNWAQQ